MDKYETEEGKLAAMVFDYYYHDIATTPKAEFILKLVFQYAPEMRDMVDEVPGGYYGVVDSLKEGIEEGYEKGKIPFLS